MSPGCVAAYGHMVNCPIGESEIVMPKEVVAGIAYPRIDRNCPIRGSGDVHADTAIASGRGVWCGRSRCGCGGRSGEQQGRGPDGSSRERNGAPESRKCDHVWFLLVHS